MSNRPHWFRETLQDGAAPIARETRKVWNRTGAALTAGGVYMFDLGLTETAESTANTRGIVLPAVTNHLANDNGSAWRNIVVTQANLKRSATFCLALESVANNEETEVLVVGEVTALPAGVTAINGAIAPWATWVPVESVTTLTVTQANATTSRLVFHNTGTLAGNGSAVTTTAAGWFNGYGF